MAPRFRDGMSRFEAHNEWDDRGDSRRGPRRDRGFDDRGPAFDPWDLHHHHHDHDHHHHQDADRQPDRGPRRGGGRFGRLDVSEDVRDGIGQLIGAVRAASRTDEGSRRAALAIMDDATRAVYRLLADGPTAQPTAGGAGAAHSPESPTEVATNPDTEGHA